MKTWLAASVAAFLVVIYLHGVTLRSAALPGFEAPFASSCAASPDWTKSRSDLMYILPHISHADIRKPDIRAALKRDLDALEPGRATGQVRLGYTLAVMPLSYYVKHGDHWVLDLTALHETLAAAADLNRPFVFYVLADHYQSYNLPFVTAMREDARNMMQYRDGSQPDETFFHFRLTAFSLSNDERIPVTRATMEAMRQIAGEIHAFDTKHPGLLVGVEINGETHQMFHDFFNGTGDYMRLDYTDYSPAALAEFGRYLAQSHRNEKAGDILGIDYRHGESGLLPISGWVKGPEAINAVGLYIDGERKGQALYPTSRMDVYELPAKQLRDPNVGFGTWLDVSDLPTGRHLLQIVAERGAGKKPVEIARRGIIVGGLNDQKIQPEIPVEKLEGKTPATLPLWEASLDVPVEGYEIRYRPIARDWLDFRSRQIADHVAAEAAIFRRAGFDGRRVFSYQFAPWMVGGWNELLFGIGHDFFRLPGMLPGINAYNGSFINPLAFSFLDPRKGYAIPETHPQMPGSQNVIAQVLRWHYCHGAVYIGPYYLRPGFHGPYEGIDRFVISEANPHWGSADYYRALRDFVRH